MVVSPYTGAELAALFAKARAALLAEDYATAAPLFERIVRLAPNDDTAPPSLFNAGVAREGLGERAEALARYDEFLRRFPDDLMARSGKLRRVRVLADLERWPRVESEAADVLAWKDLSVLEAVEAGGLAGLALVEQDKLDDGERAILKARDLVEEHRLGEAGKPPLEVASVSFALAELRKKKSESITFVPVPADFPEQLERRCTGLLDAQSAYTDAMRALDAHWSAMAGYRVGELYQRLHHDVMAIPAPAKAGTDARRQLFEGAMRLRYRVLLEKGLKMMDATVKLGERTGESSPWIERARAAKVDLERDLDLERAALKKLPYTEDELKTALDRLRTTK
jgi:tetratricopeptide (TPR) repeat protein